MPFKNPAQRLSDIIEGLSLAQVYGAIADYLDRQAEVDAYLAQRKEQWAELERQGTPPGADLQAPLEHARGSLSLPRQ